MKAFVLIFLPLVVATSACQVVGEELLQSGNATEYAFEYGTYTVFNHVLEVDDPLEYTHLCFYVPDIALCQIDVDFLSCKEQSNCIQHDIKDVINICDDETMRIIIVNFRMMPPDNDTDEAFVIRLYNRTVVWLTHGAPCEDRDHVLSPRIYYYDLSTDCSTTNPATIPQKTIDRSITCPVCSLTASPTTTPPKTTDITCPVCSLTASPTMCTNSIRTDTPTVAEGLASAEVAGICISSFITGVVAGCFIGCIGMALFKAVRQWLERRSQSPIHPVP